MLRQTLDAPSDFWQLTSGRLLDDATRAVEVTKRQTLPNRLLRVTLIVLHDVAKRHTQADRIKTQLINQFDNL